MQMILRLRSEGFFVGDLKFVERDSSELARAKFTQDQPQNFFRVEDAALAKAAALESDLIQKFVPVGRQRIL